MSNTDLFSRYTPQKMTKFNQWLQTPHGKQVYSLFKRFAHTWRDAGHAKCSASLIVNRIRWECAVTGRYQGFKVSNDHAPMLARQLVQDDPTFRDFFAFHQDNQGQGHPESDNLSDLG